MAAPTKEKKKPGRPPGSVGQNTVKSQAMRAKLLELVEKEFGPIVQANIDLATGIVVHQKVKVKGKEYDRYYTLKPDAQAQKYILDQAVGKAKETLEVSGEMTLVQLVNKLEKDE